ncbi:MAG: DUF721 domain-containing protein [Flavobacteriaceae bacterium]
MQKRKNNNLSLGEALQEFISENRLQGGIDKVKVVEAWKKLMGNGVDNYTISIELRNDILYVALSSSVLREELSHGRSKIIKMLNEELGKDLIKQLVLR